MQHIHIADDHPLFRSALLNTIQRYYPQITISESSDLDSTLKALAKKPDIDLLLLDLQMPGSEELFGLISIRKQFPSVPVIIVSACEEDTTINQAINHGASGYLPKSLPAETLCIAIKTVALEGEYWFPQSSTNDTAAISDEETLTSKMAALTPQQHRVLCFLREGLSNKQIGFELNVTEATIKAHITAIFRKLGVNNRTQAVIELSKILLETKT